MNVTTSKCSKKARTLSFFLALSLVFTLFIPIFPMQAEAAAPSLYTDLYAGTSTVVEMYDSNPRYYKFVPTATANYTFSSSNSLAYNPAAYLQDANGNNLVFDDDSNGENNFKITYQCTAGKTYYLKVWCQASWVGSFTLTVSPAPYTPPANPAIETTPGTNAYQLFNSGATGSGRYYSSSSNYDDKSYSNGGYDIYAYAGDSRITTVNLGLSFTVMQEVMERATVTINAYDVDEGSGERDVIFLVDELTGTRTRLDYLRGMNSQWNTTTLFIDGSSLIEGHTYHLELTGEVDGWVVYVRTVSILLNTSGTPSQTPTGPYIADHSFTASIDSSGRVTPILYLKTSEAVSYKLEYAATINNDQRGSALNKTMSVSADGSSQSDVFYLESGAPAGVYQIDVIIKDSQGNVVASYSTTAGYSARAVSYHSNGGSANVPIDSTSYRSGDRVDVRFDYVPSRDGYTFLGWAETPDATEPIFTEGGLNYFIMPSYDMALYAVWKEGTGPADRTISIWNGSVATEFGGGKGTSSAPYLINNASQLAYLFERIANGETFSGVYFKLTINIDLNHREWTSSGTFSGIFDGGNHYIANLSLHGSESLYVGLFPIISGATIKNLAISDYTVFAIIEPGKSGGRFGTIASKATNSVIKACSANGMFVMDSDGSTSMIIGGLVATANGVSIYDCSSELHLVGSHRATVTAGGIIGSLEGQNSATTTVSRCFATYKNSSACNERNSQIAGIIGYALVGKINVNNCVTVINNYVRDAIAFRDSICSSTLTVQLGYYVDNTTDGIYSANGNKIYTGVITDSLLTNLGWNLNSIWKYDDETGELTLGAFAKPEPHVHDVEWIYDATPTCTTSGKRHGECGPCGEYIVEILNPLGHDYEITDSSDATCVADGHTTMSCKTCGNVKYQILFAKGHDFDEDGVCVSCGFKIELHNHDFSSAVTAPTCTTVGYTTYSCACGYSYRDDYIDQLGHRFDDGVITTAKTCTTNGLITYTCTECQATAESVILASHSFIETVTLEPTCTTDGSLLRHCDDCGYEETDVIPAAHKFSEGISTTPPTCDMPGVMVHICTVCQVSETFEVPKLGHSFYNGSCERCEATIPDIITPNESYPEYGMFFEIDDTVSGYGPDLVNEYGVLLDFNADATIKKVAVFLVQEGNLWRRCIAVIGENITYATYVPYLAYSQDVKYTGLTSEWINTFSLSPNKDGIWCYNSYTTIGVNLTDSKGNLLLSLYDIGQSGAKTRVFDDLDEMVSWLKEDSDCINHIESSWIVDLHPTCTEKGSQHTVCIECGLTVSTEEIPETGHFEGGWIVDLAPTCTEEGTRHKSCTACSITLKQEPIEATGHTLSGNWYDLYAPTENAGGKEACNCRDCGIIMETKPISALVTISASNATARPGALAEVTVSLKNNPGIIGAIITIDFDPSLKLVEIRSGSALATLAFTPPKNASGSCSFVWDGAFSADTNSGILLTLVFELPVDATSGHSYEISINAANNNLLNENLQSVFATTENGSVTVVDDIVGDLNADGATNVADVLFLRRYVAGTYGITLDTAKADIDGDGEITALDVEALRGLLVEN